LIERSVSEISVSGVSRKGAVGTQLGYLEKMGELLLPRAFAFADQAVLFTGDVPYEAHWLARLLPDDAKVRVDGEDPETTSFDVVVVGRTGFYYDRMRRVLASRKEPCRFLPQEGFLDELLFGRDWWNKETRLLRASANRSGSARRAALPTVPSPRFSDEPAHDDDRVGEGDPEVDDPSVALGTPHQLLVSVIPGVGALHDPTFCGPQRSRLPFFGDHGLQSPGL